MSILTVAALPIAVATAPLTLSDKLHEISDTYWGMSEKKLLTQVGPPYNRYVCNGGQFYIWEYESGALKNDERFVFIIDSTVRETSAEFKYSSLCSQ